jgi:hypothetical protein
MFIVRCQRRYPRDVITRHRDVIARSKGLVPNVLKVDLFFLKIKYVKICSFVEKSCILWENLWSFVSNLCGNQTARKYGKVFNPLWSFARVDFLESSTIVRRRTRSVIYLCRESPRVFSRISHFIALLTTCLRGGFHSYVVKTLQKFMRVMNWEDF